MKKLIQTIKNIFKIEELRTRILYTLGLLVIYRLGSFIVLPGIDSAQLANLESLGIRRLHQTVEVELTPVTKGMVEKVRHLVIVEEI